MPPLAWRAANRSPSPSPPTISAFLKSLHIQVDQEVLDDENASRDTKMEITPQDVRFLKSLKISLDEQKDRRNSE